MATSYEYLETCCCLFKIMTAKVNHLTTVGIKFINAPL